MDTQSQNLGIGSWPARRARITPHARALSQDSRCWTYAELAERVELLAAGLTRLGVGFGDRVAYLGANDMHTFLSLFATARLGAIFVPLNIRLAVPELDHVLTDSGARVLIHTPETREAVISLSLSGVAVVGTETDVSGTTLDDLMTADSGPPAVDVALDDDCLILYTSGTTGRPKGAVLTHGNLTWNTMTQFAHIDMLSTDVVLGLAPLFHVTGLGQVTLPAFYKGAEIVVVPRFEPGRVLKSIDEQKINGFAAVPAMLQMMCDHPGFADASLQSLRYLNYGGSPIADRVAAAWWAKGVLLHQGYGMTEAAGGVYMAHRSGARERPLSMGVPHFFTDVAILVNDQLLPTESGIQGELVASGPHIFRGYWRAPESSAAAFHGRWFRTGDVVRADPDGWAYVVDRVKDMIISGGENVYPAEVEAVAAQLPWVASCAVVAVPDPRWGEVGMAYVTALPGVSAEIDSLRTHLTANLAKYKVPKYITVVDELPVTATGKIRRPELRADALTRIDPTPHSPTQHRENQ